MKTIPNTKAELSRLKNDVEKLVKEFSNKNPDVIPSVQVYPEFGKSEDGKTKIKGFKIEVNAYIEV